jgi:hypothetical protein
VLYDISLLPSAHRSTMVSFTSQWTGSNASPSLPPLQQLELRALMIIPALTAEISSKLCQYTHSGLFDGQNAHPGHSYFYEVVTVKITQGYGCDSSKIRAIAPCIQSVDFAN